ncbi:MAG TPA: hypothetical protein VII53_01575 [Solirubrobacteraceae bacterium]
MAVSVALVGACVFSTPALAAPEWGIEMTHANAYGLQVGECPGGVAKYVPGSPEEDCGVDPFTGSGKTFSQESGFNTYKITVKNTGSPTLVAGDKLSCDAGLWIRDESTFEYHWLRDGAQITGAEESEYTITSQDPGNALQCQVEGLNASYTTSATTTAVMVPPELSVSSPALKPETEVKVSEESGTVATGTPQTCTPGEWAGSPVLSYQWLRNGADIPGATGPVYTPVAADEGTAVQCQVTATNGGGTVVAVNRYPLVVAPAPIEESEYPAHPEDGSPALPSGAATSGPVTIAARLPNGVVLAAEGVPAAGGAGWGGAPGEGTCTITNGATGVTCRTSTELAPGENYPPITLHVRAGSETPLGSPPAGGVTSTAVVSGGGASSAVASDPTTVTARVPFGIARFETSITESLGAPFTQAGGHPFAANATFAFNNSVVNDGELQTAGGTPKDVETELPPGFVGNPLNAQYCTTSQLQQPLVPTECPAGSVVGFATVVLQSPITGGRSRPFANAATDTYSVFNLEPSPGNPAAFGFVDKAAFVLNAKLRSNGDYGITIGDTESGRDQTRSVQAVSLTLCSYGVTGHANEGVYEKVPATIECAAPSAGVRPFLTMPTECAGSAPSTTLRANTYQEPADYVSKSVYNGTSLAEGAPSATESFVTGCSDLQFQAKVEFKPSSGSEGGTSQADEPTGATFALKVPQTNEAGVNATPELKNATVTLPEGMTVDPSAADGLQACSNAQFGLGSTVEPTEPAECPLASQIGTVKVVTPLLEKPLEGKVFLGEPECSPCNNGDAEDGHIFRLFLQVRSVERGVIVKLAGHVTANPTTGRLQATFSEQPQLPFGELLLTFNGGARASLANPQTCGTFTTTSDLTPWSTSGLGGLSGTEPIAGTPDATPSSSFNVDWNGAGGACPATMPFSPSFSAGSQTPTAGASSPFAVTIGREDREQDLSDITVSTPPGLLGKIAGISQCPEAQANAGTCGPGSQIGTTTVGAGPGPHPFYLGGRVYLTGPYKGQPFGLSIVTRAVAGPFNLGTVVVRAAIAVNPSTAALTIVSDSLPQYVDGVQLRLRSIHVEVNRPGFMLNPTSCAGQGVGASITGAQGASVSVSSPFEVGGCQNLPFGPGFSASTQGKTSKAGGASLTITVRPAAGEANIGKVDVQLPKALPARLIPTLQNACTEAQFNANPADCPADSFVGTATAVTPILNAPLSGPAILVSHGGAAFPDLEFLLQGENGVEIVLDGKTDIKGGITYSKFESVPDAPISSFVTTLPEGPHSILAAPGGNLCGKSLVMPTTITAQNGKQIIQKTKITVTGCAAVKIKPLTRTQKLKRALHACRTKYKAKGRKAKRLACEVQARRRYGPIKKTKKSNRRGK